MQPVLVLIATAALGIDVGWQPLETGGVEYIIQIAPSEVDRLQTLDDLISDVPANLDVRRYRITVGKGELPQVAPETSAKMTTDDDLAKPTDNTPKTYAIPAVVIDPVANLQQATANKPISGRRDPEPEDEELLATPPSLKRNEPEPRRNDLLLEQPSRSYRAAEPEIEERPAIAPKRKANLSSRMDDEPAISDYEVQKAPSLSHSLRTAALSHDRPAISEPDAAEPWGPMLMSLLLLVISLAANLYLGWIAWESRIRYRMLLDKYRSHGGKATFEPI